MAKGISVKEVHKLCSKIRYSYLEDELQEFIKDFKTDDVIIYGLVIDEIENKKYWITNKETGMIERTEDNKQKYDEYIRLNEIAEKLGNKLI